MLLDRTGIIARLAAANAAAGRELSELESMESPCLPDYQTHIRRYVLYKFLLDDEPDIRTDDLNELAALSVKKAANLNPNEPVLLDMSRHCGATTSAMTKKVLPFMSLSKELGVELNRYDTADIRDTAQLGQILFEAKVKQV